MRVRGFPPLAGRDPKVLVLGSTPGRVSLAAGEYYAHPQNAFRQTFGALGVVGGNLAYAERLAGLMASRAALWDVLAVCDPPGSLDASIVAESEVPNDVAALIATHPSLRHVLFNGAKAERALRRHILPKVPPHVDERL